MPLTAFIPRSFAGKLTAMFLWTRAGIATVSMLLLAFVLVKSNGAR